jgi:hypothetical protein
MKKIFVVMVLILALPVFAFAQHPSGWGIGVMGQYNMAWDGFGRAPGAALSLKAPQLPIYWGANMELRGHGIGLSLTGDYYLIDKALSSYFGWYFGIGAYAGFHSYNDESKSERWTSIRGGLRAPIGIYIMPVRFFELFLDVAPSLGVGLYFGNYSDERFKFPEGGLGGDVGIRFWF